MTFTSAEHSAIRRQSQHQRADHARARRAAGAPVSRKVPVVVDVLETVDLLVTSDASNERGRYFRVTVEGEQWRCSCSSFVTLGGCHYIGHLSSVSNSTPEGGG